jgi:O-antigen ligase
VGIGLQPISTATGNIGFGIAIAGAIPLLIVAPAQFAACWQSLWIRWLAAWVVLSWVSLLWSSDPQFGVDQFRACRVLLWIPLLWPLRSQWPLLVGAVIGGAAVIQVIQALQVSPLGWLVSAKRAPGHGLTTPTQTGMWDAISLCFLLSIPLIGKWRRALLILPLATLATAGLIWTAARAAVLGFIVQLIAIGAVHAWCGTGRLGRAMAQGLVGAALLAVVFLMADSTHLRAKVEKAAHETADALTGIGAVTSEYRLAMWSTALEGWQQHALLGAGIGGIPNTIMKPSTVVYERHRISDVRMIHSTYLQVLAETGLVGAALFAAFVWCFLRDALTVIRRDPARIGALGACLVWFVGAAFDGYQQSGGFLSIGAICMALAAMPAGTDVDVHLPRFVRSLVGPTDREAVNPC